MTIRKVCVEAVRRTLGLATKTGRVYAELCHRKRLMKVKMMGVDVTPTEMRRLSKIPDVTTVLRGSGQRATLVYFQLTDDEYTAAVIETRYTIESRQAAADKRAGGLKSVYSP